MITTNVLNKNNNTIKRATCLQHGGPTMKTTNTAYTKLIDYPDTRWIVFNIAKKLAMQDHT